MVLILLKAVSEQWISGYLKGVNHTLQTVTFEMNEWVCKQATVCRQVCHINFNEPPSSQRKKQQKITKLYECSFIELFFPL